MKRYFSANITIIVMLWLLCCVTCYAKTNCWYYISSDYSKGIAFRKEANGDSKLYERLPFGTEFYVNDEKGEWLKTTVNGNEGWIHRDYVTDIVDPGILCWYTVSFNYKKGIAIREAPDGKVITRLPFGTDVYVYDYKNEWFHVFCEDYNVDGWMHSGYLKYNDKIFSNPFQSEEDERISKEVADEVMYDYVYETYGATAERSGTRWSFCSVEPEDTPCGASTDYCYFITSYTGATGYYYVDSYSGDVWEQWRPPHLSEYQDMSYSFNILSDY